MSRRSLAEAKERLGEFLASAPSAEHLGDQLFEVVHLLDGTPALRRVWSDGSVAGERKSALAQVLLGERISATATQVVQDVVQRRWSRPRDLGDAIEELAVLCEVEGADRAGRLDDLEDDLFRFGRILEGNPELRAALTSQTAPPDSKRALLARLLEGKATEPTQQLLAELSIYPRGRTFEQGLEDYGRIAAERRSRIVALVRTAMLFTDAQRERLARALASQYGRDVHLNIEIDPTVLGGLVVQIGDEIIDGTVRRRLDEAHRRFAA